MGKSKEQVKLAPALARGSAGGGCGHGNAVISHISAPFLSTCAGWAPPSACFWKGMKANGSWDNQRELHAFLLLLIFLKVLKREGGSRPGRAAQPPAPALMRLAGEMPAPTGPR